MQVRTSCTCATTGHMDKILDHNLRSRCTPYKTTSINLLDPERLRAIADPQNCFRKEIARTIRVIPVFHSTIPFQWNSPLIHNGPGPLHSNRMWCPVIGPLHSNCMRCTCPDTGLLHNIATTCYRTTAYSNCIATTCGVQL